MEPKASRQRAVKTEVRARVSAIVVTRGVGHPIELSLRSALADPLVDQLVVVDNGSAPEVASLLRSLAADRRDVTLLQGQGDIGHAAGCNLGAANADGQWLLFLEPTVVMKRGAVARMIAAGREGASPWVVGGRLLDTRGREHVDGRGRGLSAGAAIVGALGLERRGENGAVCSAMMLTPRPDFERLGGFEGGEVEPVDDLDFCRKAAEAGGSVMVAPRAEAVQFAQGPLEATNVGRGMAALVRRAARSPMDRVAAAAAEPFLRVLYRLRRDWMRAVRASRR